MKKIYNRLKNTYQLTKAHTYAYAKNTIAPQIKNGRFYFYLVVSPFFY